MQSNGGKFPSPQREDGDEIPPRDFGQLVRDALRHLYDPVYLQTHPLTHVLLDPGAGAVRRGKDLCQILSKAIASLRPESGVTDDRATRRHDLLTLRYMEALSIAEVCEKLGISRREYSRQHHQALDAVATLLQDSARGTPPVPVPVAESMLVPPPIRLPVPLTSFIGREREIAEVRHLIASARLVTLTGSPGTGKTRLALRVAEELAVPDQPPAPFPDGVFFVPLAPVPDSQLLMLTIAQAFGVREVPGRSLTEVLAHFLARRRVLLVLDNFEHVIDAAPSASDLLSSCPHLSVLVTSRQALRLSGEHEFVVPPLQVPRNAEDMALDRFRRVEAIRLYMDRASAAGSTFHLSDQNAAAVMELCRRLDGLPLAIELAAARSRIFPPYALLARLTGRDEEQGSPLELLNSTKRDTPHRHRTLRNAIDWSYRLLTHDEQLLLARLSVFAGSWSLEAADAVCHVQGLDVIAGMESLLDKSVIRLEEGLDGESRFGMLEMIRDYTREQLAARGEETAWRRKHAEYYLAMAGEAYGDQWGPRQAKWLRLISGELDNLRAALAWLRDNGEVESALQLGGMLVWFWHDSGRWTEARTWLESILAVAGPDHRTAGRVSALGALGVCRWCLGDLATLQAEAEEGLAICRELGDRRRAGHTLHGLGVLAAEQGDLTRARALMEESLELSRAEGDLRFVGLSLHHLVMYALQGRDEETARAHLEESQHIWHELGSAECLSMASNELGDLAWWKGEYAEAAAHYRESLRLLGEDGPRGWQAYALHWLGYAIHRMGNDQEVKSLFVEALALCRQLNDRRGVAESVAGVACSLTMSQPERTVRLIGAARAAVQGMGLRFNPVSQCEHDEILANARAELGDAAFDLAWALGRKMTLEQAVVETVSCANQERSASSRGVLPGGANSI